MTAWELVPGLLGVLLTLCSWMIINRPGRLVGSSVVPFLRPAEFRRASTDCRHAAPTAGRTAGVALTWNRLTRSAAGLLIVVAALLSMGGAYFVARRAASRPASDSLLRSEDLRDAQARGTELIEKSRRDAEQILREAELKARDEAIRRREEVTRELENARTELRELERRAEKREDAAEQRHKELLRKEKHVESLKEKLADRKETLERNRNTSTRSSRRRRRSSTKSRGFPARRPKRCCSTVWNANCPPRLPRRFASTTNA
ncbi:MAG: Rnase Y domain-containing protein [Gemmataceae bacterium]